MADINWDASSTIDNESDYSNSSKNIINSPAWEGVDLVNQTIDPTNTDVMGNVDYPENINSADIPAVTQMVMGGVGGWQGTKLGFNAPVPPLYKPITALIGGMTGSFIGGSTADFAKQGFYSLTKNDETPDNWQQSVNSAFGAGSEEALYELLGQTVVGSIRKLWSFTRGTPKYQGDIIQDTTKTKMSEDGKRELPIDENSYRAGNDPTVLAEGEEYVPVTVMLRDLIEANGGNLTAAQVSSGFIVQTLEGLASASWGGGKFTASQELTDKAITQLVDEYIKHFNQTGKEILDSVGVGAAFKHAIETGQAQHSAVGGQMFDYLDTLYADTLQKTVIKKEVPSGFLDASGAMINRTETQTVEEIIQPVSLKTLKELAAKKLEVGAETAGISNGDWGGALLEKIIKSNDKISFKAAQELRSFFLAESRNLDTKFGEGQVKKMMSDLERLLATALDNGASATGNKSFIDQYKLANEFWKDGAQTVKTKNIASILKNDPEKIGAHIFASGNVSLIQEARIALNKSAEFAKNADKKFGTNTLDFNANEVFEKMQSGYLETLLAGSRDDAATVLQNIGESNFAKAKNKLIGTSDIVGQKDILGGSFSVSNLNKLFKKGTPLNDTFKTAFTKKQQVSIRDFTQVLAAASRKTSAAGDFMVKVGQAGLVLDTFGVIPEALSVVEQGQSATNMGIDVAKYTLSPMIVAKILTSPRTTRLLARSMTMSPTSQQAGGVMAQLLAAIADIYEANPLSASIPGGQ